MELFSKYIQIYKKTNKQKNLSQHYNWEFLVYGVFAIGKVTYC